MPRLPDPAPASRARAGAHGRIRLRHLQCFIAATQFGNLRRAAQALAITQPAVTKTLNELEDMLAAPLFVRGRHGATLTAAGQAFLRHATDSVAALGLAVDSVLAEPASAPLRVGALPTIAPAFLPGVLKAFARVCPRLGVSVRTASNADLIEALRARELDVVLGRLADPERLAGLSFESLYSEPMVIALRPGHALAERAARGARRRTAAAAPALAAIGAYPLVLPPHGTLVRQVADGFLQRHGIQLQAGWVETLETALARGLALEGDNLWFTPIGTVLPDLAAGTLRQLGVELTPMESIGLLLRSEGPGSAGAHAFVAAVRAQAVVRRAAAIAPAGPIP
jgi:LysR family pca operon transcriptional activator